MASKLENVSSARPYIAHDWLNRSYKVECQRDDQTVHEIAGDDAPEAVPGICEGYGTERACCRSQYLRISEFFVPELPREGDLGKEGRYRDQKSEGERPYRPRDFGALVED